MNSYDLYEYIFCSEQGARNRTGLIEVRKDRLPELKLEHEKHGVKINGKAIPLPELSPCE